MSYISSLKTQFKRNRELILTMIEVSLAHYNMHRVRMGFEYVDAILLDDSEGKKILGDSKDFWKWWNLQWDLKDKAWLAEVLDREGLPVPILLQAEYYQLHNVENNRIYPSTSLIHDIFTKAKK